MLLWGKSEGPRSVREPVAADDPAHQLEGRLLDDRYEITGVLARGGMGVVYDGMDRLLDRPVVVKVVAPDVTDPTSGPRLIREARIACRAQHPFIVTVFHLGLLDDRDPYLVMEKLEGKDLSSYLAESTRGPLSLATVVALLEPIAEALSTLHALGVVHRDVKPDNVFVLAGPAQPPRVKLIDFGLALLDSRTAARFTATGKLLGTAEYISPECARGGPATAASDVYALATTAYELLCGELPFGGTGVELLLAKTRERPRSLGEKVEASWVARADEVLARALDRDPSKRPSVMELVRGLRAIVDGPMALPSVSARETAELPMLLSAPMRRDAPTQLELRAVPEPDPEPPPRPKSIAPTPAPTSVVVWVALAASIASLIASIVSLAR